MQPSGRHNASLLLIEENPVILASLRDWLSLAFPDVYLIETTDHRHGVALNRSESPDVVLMDISNLGEDAAGTVRTLKAARPAARVFALITVEDRAYQQAILRAGAEACACMWKLRTALLPRLREHLTGERGAPLATVDDRTEESVPC